MKETETGRTCIQPIEYETQLYYQRNYIHLCKCAEVCFSDLYKIYKLQRQFKGNYDDLWRINKTDKITKKMIFYVFLITTRSNV